MIIIITENWKCDVDDRLNGNQIFLDSGYVWFYPVNVCVLVSMGQYYTVAIID